MVRKYWQKGLILSLATLTLQSSVSFGKQKAETLLDQLPSVSSAPIPPASIDITDSNYVAVGQSNASQFGQLLWEQQDSIQQEVLSGLNSLGPGFNLLKHDMDKDNYQFDAGVDITAKRYIHPINLGIPEGGYDQPDPQYPDQAPRSGWVVVDYLRTGLTAGFGTRGLYNKVFGASNHGASAGLGFEAGQIVQKVSIINSTEDFERYRREDDETIKKQMNRMNVAQYPIQQGYKGYLEAGFDKVSNWALDILFFASAGVGSFARWGAHYFESGALADMFEGGFKDPYKLKQELFYTDDKSVLNFTRPGDVLSFINFKNFGPSLSAGYVRSSLSVTPLTVYTDHEIRITRLTPAQCDLADAKEECKKVLVSFITYSGRGSNEQIDVRMKFLGLKPWWTHISNTHFFQTELQYKYDLSNDAAVKAFNHAVNVNSPSLDETIQAANDASTTGVRKQLFSVIGDALEMPKDDKDLGKYKMTAESNISETRLQLILLTDDRTTQTTYYKKCEVDFDDVGLALGPPQCTFDGLTQKSIVKVNYINLDFLLPGKFLKSHLGSAFDFRAHSTEVNSFETFADLNTEVDEKGANLHFRYTLSDKFPKADSYFNYNLKIIKTMFGLEEPGLKAFYDGSPEGRALRDKVLIDLDNRAKREPHLAEKVQGLNADIYMSQAYTNEIFKSSPEQIQNVIAEIVQGNGVTWKQLFKVHDQSTACPVNWKYNGMITPRITGTSVTCFELQNTATAMWNAFSEIAKSAPEKRLTKLTEYNNVHGRKPFIPLMMLLAGRDYSQHVANGDLGIQFYYEAQDLVDTNDLAICKKDSKAADEKMTSLLDMAHHGCRLEGFKPYVGQLSVPPPGTPRIVNLIAVADKKSLATADPKLIINFYSDLERTPDNALTAVPGQKFRISGYINKYRSVGYNYPMAKFEFSQAVPKMEKDTNKGHVQYHYTFQLTDLLTKGGLKKGQDYVVDFSLSDPAKNAAGEFINYSEVVEVRFQLPKK